MPSTATLGMETRARKRKRERRDANAGEAISGLLNDIVVTHVLRSDSFDDPADLARLPAVSRAMRDTMAGAGLQFAELYAEEAAWLGCFSAMERLQRQGLLPRQESLCEVAARNGNLERSCWSCARKAARGTSKLAGKRRRAGTSTCFSGCARMSVRGTL